MRKRDRRFQTWMIENAYLVMIGCVLAMVAGCALYTHSLQIGKDVQAAADAPEIRQSVQPVHTPRLTPLPTIAPLAVRPAVWVQSEQSGGIWPLEGRIIRPYDAQQSVYWESLGLWKAHCGLDIAGQVGESVCASKNGAVTGTAWDPLWGWRVIIDHDNGIQMHYAGLESCCVKEGGQVRAGQMIGTLMERIPCEAEMDTHLHLEMRRKGKHQDPEAALAER